MPEGARNGESASEFTLNNFKHCMNNIFSDIAKDSTALLIMLHQQLQKFLSFLQILLIT